MLRYLELFCAAIGGFTLSRAIISSLGFVMVYSGGGEWTRLHQWKCVAVTFWWLSLLVWTILFALANRELGLKHPNDQTRVNWWINVVGFLIPLGLVWLHQQFSFFWLPITLPIVSFAVCAGFFSGARRTRFACWSLLFCAGTITATMFTLQWKDDARHAEWAKKHPIGRD